jgi:hypothetical protein
MRNLAWVGAQTGGFAPQSMGMLNTIEYVELKKNGIRWGDTMGYS